LFPQQIIEELLSVAHVQAVAARAGVSISSFDKDFGVDGTFRQTMATGNRRFTSGYALDFQLKASTKWVLEPEFIAYDLEVKSYNDLVHRRVSSSNSKFKTSLGHSSPRTTIEGEQLARRLDISA
jgi:Domain of unknown function (DUF4365)